MNEKNYQKKYKRKFLTRFQKQERWLLWRLHVELKQSEEKSMHLQHKKKSLKHEKLFDFKFDFIRLD